MGSELILACVLGYFALLITVSFLTSRGSTDNDSFFSGKRQSPWYLVAFGMIGASLSGVTFLSIPGTVGKDGFTYMQMVFGYLLGYLVIANILLPLYYRLNLTSIYTYLDKRYGNSAYKTGASFFLLSRIFGSALRLYLVAIVFYNFVFEPMGVPFWVTVFITLLLIWVYSFKGGIKTIVYTDTLQTFFMLLSVVISIWFITKELNLNIVETGNAIANSHYSEWFVWDTTPKNNFWKHLFGGMFITIVMTGLDQDMMQKNLTCKSLPEAKKNMYWMSSILVVVNILFLTLGALLYLYATQKGLLAENFADTEKMAAKCPIELKSAKAGGAMLCRTTDVLFPYLAFEYFPPFAGITFIIGLVAAAYSTADSALTALTTSFCVDFLGFKPGDKRVKTRKLVHVGVTLVLFGVILVFKEVNNDAVINEVFTIAGYTYGPLLGLFSFGIFTKKQPIDAYIPLVCIAAPVLSYLLAANSEYLLNGYKFGFELLLINGLLTFLGLALLPNRPQETETSAILHT